MASKLLLTDEVMAIGKEEWASSLNEFEPVLGRKKSSKLWLFMIGGSASGIITPLSRFFISQLAKEIVVPVFIDNQCHSHSTSAAITDIARYEEYCRLTGEKSKISQPFLFIENSIQSLKARERFQSILNHIKEDDEVFVAFSAHSNFSVSIATGIAHLCKDKIVRTALKCGIFMPYLTFSTNDDVSDVLKEINEVRESNLLEKNLALIDGDSDYFSAKFIVGLSRPSIVKEACYQKNPFNLVQLIMAYAIVSLPNQSGWFEYVIQSDEDFVVPRDVIRDDSFRQLLIKYDFTNLAFHFLLHHKSLPKELNENNALTDIVTSYLKTSSDGIQSLGDITVHRSNRMLLRKDENLNSISLNRAFTHKRIFGTKPYSVNELKDYLTSHIQQNKIFNSNMAIHETLVSTHIFIRENFKQISELYY